MRSPGRPAAPRALTADLDWTDTIRFDQFTLLPAERRLQKSGGQVPLGTRAFDLLVALTEHAPRVVSKEELFERAWPGVVPEENNLRFQINGLRKALGDDPAGGRYIATVQGRGYCFVAHVWRAPRARPEDAEHREARPDDALKTNLPLPMHPIVDRERELAELANSLQQHSLITVLGSGGVGKTRLAIELGRRVLADYPDGVWLVDLAPLSDPRLIASATATVLDLPADLTAEALARRLANRAMLLILDNCEHLVEAVASFVEVLVSSADALSVLATSQESLRVAEEQVYRLEPLALAPGGAAEIAQYGAIALFVELARRTDRRFALSAQNAESVAEVCRRLDGVPLALEMATARLPMLGIEGLRSGLSERLSLLKRDPSRSDGRHASLRQLAEWSYGLLDETDQQVFCRLAVFPGSFALDAAAAIMAPIGIDRWGTLDALWRLREKSLIALEHDTAPRYRLLETLRLYALERLQESGDSDAVAEQHALHFAEVFQRGQSTWETTPDLDWIALYRPEIDNLRTALDWVLAEPERRHVALSLAAPSLRILEGLFLILEARRYGGRLASLLDDDTPPAAAAELMLQIALCWQNSRSPDIEAYLERAVALYRDLDDPLRLGRALHALGGVHRRQRRYAQAEACYAEARDIAPLSNSGKLQVSIQLGLGALATNLNDYSLGMEYISRALVLSQDLRTPTLEIICLSNLATIEYGIGNLDQAVDRGKETVALARATPGGRYLSLSLVNLAAYLLALGHAEEARAPMEEAWAHFGENELATVTCLQICAVLAAFEGRLREAAQLIGFVDAERVRSGQLRQPSEQRLYNELTRRLEMGLPTEELLALKAEGALWSEAGAIRFTDARLFGPELRAAASSRLTQSIT